MAGNGGFSFLGRVVLGWAAGFFATLIFHQLTLLVLYEAGIAPFGPFAMTPTYPFGEPAFVSLAFWGGVWGIVFAFIHDAFPRGAAYWVVTFMFGAVAPSVVALLVVMPLKGMKPGGIHAGLIVTALLVNGAWGIGTALFLKGAAVLSRRQSGPRL